MAEEDLGRPIQPESTKVNPDLPPVEFPAPKIASRKRERHGYAAPPPIPAEERRAIALAAINRVNGVQRRIRELSPEARRAIFLKLTHDRAISQDDLSGTGMVLLGEPSETESLVAPRVAGDLSQLEARLTKFGDGDEPDRPPGTELATKIRDVALAEPKDRLSDAFARDYGTLAAAEFVKYEIEIISFASNRFRIRREIQDILGQIRRSLGNGVHGQVYQHEDFGRWARVLVGTTGAKLKEFVEATEWQRSIVYFDERPKFETFNQVFGDFSVANVRIEPPPEDAETVCVIDTGIAAANPFLQPVLRTDISRSFVDGFSPIEDRQGHGSGVASLAAYYAIDLGQGAVNRAACRVVSARIMNDEGQLDVAMTDDIEAYRRQESRLLSLVLRQIVEHYVPLGIRTYVFAFQIHDQIWSKATKRMVPRNAWLARTLDRLSRDFDVVFVTITGNIDHRDVAELHAHHPHPAYLSNPLAKLHDPGQASLTVTTGSIAPTAVVVAAPLQAIALGDQPSPFTRTGPGFADSIKPDFVERGGNYVFDQQLNLVRTNVGTSVVMASSQLTPAVQLNVGTSFAAPRVAHHLIQIARSLRLLGVSPSAPLLRAFLASTAQVPEAARVLPDYACAVGYGLPDGFSATDCYGYAIVLFWQGHMQVDQTAIFRFHVPADLVNVGRGVKRITVSVASSPPVQPIGTEEYLGAEMKFRLYRGDRDYQQIEQSVQLLDGEENKAPEETVGDMDGDVSITRRSAGTLQRCCFEWKDHDAAYSADDYTLVVWLNAASWAREDVVVPLGVVVRVEDTTTRYAELYAQVRARARARAQS